MYFKYFNLKFIKNIILSDKWKFYPMISTFLRINQKKKPEQVIDSKKLLETLETSLSGAILELN